MTSTKHRRRFAVRRCSNVYDHLARRVQKITPEATHTYFYDGWMLVKEVVERSGDSRRCGVSPRHCGGAGSSTSLGEDAAGSRVSMEEDVIFGKLISGSGPMADVFSLRYSTKYFDPETGFYYYGRRFCSPVGSGKGNVKQVFKANIDI